LEWSFWRVEHNILEELDAVKKIRRHRI